MIFRSHDDSVDGKLQVAGLSDAHKLNEGVGRKVSVI